MLPQSIIDKILRKYGKDRIYSGDCYPLSQQIGLSETTVKRMLGLVGADSPERNRTPHNSTMDILARWLGYDCYKSLLREISDEDFSSEFTSMQALEAADIEVGTQIQLRYDPDRSLLMTYLGASEFMINESRNSKLRKGDRIKMTHLVVGQEMLVSNVVRDGNSLGGYRAAKDGGLTAIEIII